MIFPITSPFASGFFQPAMFGYRSNNWGWFDHPSLSFLRKVIGDFLHAASHGLNQIWVMFRYWIAMTCPRHPQHLLTWVKCQEEEYHQHIQKHRFGDTRRKGGFDCLRRSGITPWSGNGNRVLADDFTIFFHFHFAKRGCAPCAVIFVANDFPMFFRSCCFPEKVVPPSDHYFFFACLQPQSGAL